MTGWSVTSSHRENPLAISDPAPDMSRNPTRAVISPYGWRIASGSPRSTPRSCHSSQARPPTRIAGSTTRAADEVNASCTHEVIGNPPITK